MRLPNGYGSVYKLSGKRRRPFVARKTVGFKEENGHPIYEIIGYYADRKEALTALAVYNQSPYDLTNRKLTFSELYDIFVQQKYTDNDKKIKYGYAAAYKACTEIHNCLFSDLRTAQFQKIINDWDKGYSSKKNMRILFNLLYKFAMQNDIADKNYASFIELNEPDEKSDKHKPFTTEELATLWENSADRSVQYVLIYCYSGLRPSELVGIKTSDVHLKERYMVGGIKTRNSKNRAIPIAEKIYPFIASMYNQENEFLTTDFDGPLTYDRMNWRYWKPLMEKLDMKHFPHDGRHTCATLLDNCGVNKTVIKKILGHAGASTTEKVYTHKTIQQLVDAINMI